MKLVRNAVATGLSFAFLAAGCGSNASPRDAKSTAQAEYTACPMYCIDGDAACLFDDGTCQFACNQCLCESAGGQWNPGVSCD